MKIEDIAYNQGIADWLRYARRCPPYYKGSSLECVWLRGQRYAEDYAKRNRK